MALVLASGDAACSTATAFPPALHNVEAEMALLGSLLVDNRQADRVAELVDANDFADPFLGSIYEIAMREIGAGRLAIPPTIAPMFDADGSFQALGGRRWLAELTGSVAANMPIQQFAVPVRQVAIRRRLWSAMREASAALEDPIVPLADVVTTHETALTGAIEHTTAPTFRSSEDCVDEVIASLTRTVTGISSGTVGTLDTLLGPLQPGDLIIIAARPGMGKTAAALSYMRGASILGYCSLFASLEMSWEQLSNRLVLDHCFTETEGVRANALREGKLTPEERRIICRAREPIASMSFKVIDQRCHTLSQLRRAIRRRKRELAITGQSLDLVIVDYLQLLQPDQRGRSEYESLSEVSRELKVMAKAEGVVMMALAQLSREPEKRADKRPILSDLRGSGQIEQDADAVVFLYAEEYYLQSEKPDQFQAAEYEDWQSKMRGVANRLEFIAPKVRNGAAGNDVGYFYRQYQAVRGGEFRRQNGAAR